MSNETLQIYPRNYYKVFDRLIFFLDSSRLDESEMQQILSELQEVKMLEVINQAKGGDGKWFYVAYLKRLSILFTEGEEQNCFVVSSMYQGKDFQERKSNAKKKNNFILIPAGGIYIIYSQKMYPGDENADWNMKEDLYYNLTKAMTDFFNRPGIINLKENANHFHISNEFDRRIFRPFLEEAGKEEWVERNIIRNNIESKYMYEMFSDFSTGDYEKVGDDLPYFIAEKTRVTTPPNQMQMEAIIKGIQTDSILLVLSPLGTGKSTIISQWVEYFVKNNKRVLVSAQDNETVDHVLEIFKEKTNEIVRLGSEFAIQESCKKYLPKNKLQPFKEAFQNNFQRVHQERIHNLNELERYEKELTLLLDRLKIYQEFENLWKENSVKINECLKTIFETKQDIDDEMASIDNIQDEEAHMKIFLDYLSAQKSIVQNKYRYHEKRAKDALKQFTLSLREHQGEYLLKLEHYKKKVDMLEEVRDEVRTNGVMEGFAKARQGVMEFVDRMDSVENPFFPDIKGEFANFYQKPFFNKEDMTSNRKMLEEDFIKMQELRSIIDRAENVLNDWEKAVNEKNESIYKSILVRSGKIVGATCNNIKSDKDIQKARFDVVIMDEAGRIPLANALVPMTMAKKSLLLGDFKQIYPSEFGPISEMIKEEDLDEKISSISLFEYLFESLRKVTEKRFVDSGKDKAFFARPVLMSYEVQEGRAASVEEVESMIQHITQDSRKTVVLTDAKTRKGDIAGAKHIFG